VLHTNTEPEGGSGRGEEGGRRISAPHLCSQTLNVLCACFPLPAVSGFSYRQFHIGGSIWRWLRASIQRAAKRAEATHAATRVQVSIAHAATRAQLSTKHAATDERRRIEAQARLRANIVDATILAEVSMETRGSLRASIDDATTRAQVSIASRARLRESIPATRAQVRNKHAATRAQVSTKHAATRAQVTNQKPGADMLDLLPENELVL